MAHYQLVLKYPNILTNCEHLLKLSPETQINFVNTYFFELGLGWHFAYTCFADGNQGVYKISQTFIIHIGCSSQ